LSLCLSAPAFLWYDDFPLEPGILGKGKFITFEGIEGCGKTLQLSLLEAELCHRLGEWVFTREPGGTEFGRELRQILLGKGSAPRAPVAELLLYMADRVQHLDQVIRPALARGAVVLCDRYLDATLAYQGHARGLGFPLIDEMAAVLGLLKPDLTLVLDLDVELALSRARQRNRLEGSDALGRFEAEETEFHRRVQEGYRLLAAREPQRFVMVDAGGTPEEVASRVRSLVAEKAGLFDEAR